MRRLAVIPLALLLGCWDFDSLSGGYVPPIVDASTPGDIACGKMPNTLKEDCTQNGDINNNCLVGCDDPDCSDHIACFASRGYKTYGAIAAAGSCPAQSTQSTPIFRNLTPPANCNSTCMLNSATGTCSSMLHIYSKNMMPAMNQTDCAGAANETQKVAIVQGNNQCTAAFVGNSKDAYYSVDKFTAGGCSPKNATMPLSAPWTESKVLCDQSASKLLRFSEMERNGISCVVFDGTDATVCAAAAPYTKATVYYQSASGSSTCTCTATPSGGCTLTQGATNLLNLTDKAMCNGMGAMLTPIPMDSTCVQATIGMTSYQAVAAVSSIAAPTCNVAGAVSGAFMPQGGLTFCCVM